MMIWKLGQNCAIDVKINPYLLIFYSFHLDGDDSKRLFKIVAINCDRLCQCAKKELLQKYYRVLFNCDK